MLPLLLLLLLLLLPTRAVVVCVDDADIANVFDNTVLLLLFVSLLLLAAVAVAVADSVACFRFLYNDLKLFLPELD